MATKKPKNTFRADPVKPKNSDPSVYLDGPDKDAYKYLVSLFSQWGLADLAPEILKYIQAGYSPDTIQLELRSSQAYKKRFSANEARVKAGMPALAPNEYIAVEDSIRQVMHEAGLPTGFYDSPDDFTKFIADDVSASEIKTRVDGAREFIYQFPDAKTFLDEWYQSGKTEGDAIATILDPKRALPLTEQRLRAAELASKVSGITRGTAEQIAAQGLTADAIRQGSAIIGQEYDRTARLAAIYQIGYSVDDLANEVFLNDPYATEARKKLASRERAMFSAQGGQSNTSLGTSTAGSY
jgi:hypothetical protein